MINFNITVKPFTSNEKNDFLTAIERFYIDFSDSITEKLSVIKIVDDVKYFTFNNSIRVDLDLGSEFTTDSVQEILCFIYLKTKFPCHITITDANRSNTEITWENLSIPECNSESDDGYFIDLLVSRIKRNESIKQRTLTNHIYN